MVKLKKILPDASKNYRSRRNVLSIQITILGWLVELFGFLTFVLGSFILGNKTKTVTMILQVIMSIFYGIFLPCTVLLNSSEVKDKMAKSSLYLSFLSLFGCLPKYHSTPEKEDDCHSNEFDQEGPLPNDAVEPILDDDASSPMRHNEAADVNNSISESEH